MSNEQKIQAEADKLLEGIVAFPDGVESVGDANDAMKRLKVVQEVVDNLDKDYKTEFEKLQEKYSPLFQSKKEDMELMMRLEIFGIKNVDVWDNDKLTLEEGALSFKDGGTALLVDDKVKLSDIEINNVVSILKRKLKTDYLEYIKVVFSLKKNEIKQAIGSDLFDEKFCKEVGFSVKPTKKFNIQLFSE